MTEPFSSGAEAIAALQLIQPDNLAGTITWIDRFLYSVFEPGLGIATVADWQTIGTIFADRGYAADANSLEKFVESDPTNHGVWVIGQFVSLVETLDARANAMSQFIRRCCQDWTQMFVGPSA